MKQPLSLVRHFIILTLAVFIITSCSKEAAKPKILVFTKTAGYVHESIPEGIASVVKLGAENGFEVDTTARASVFTEDSLKQYAAIVFLSTTGDVLNHRQEAEFERYIQAGGGYVGIHAASDTEYDWGWYGRLVGGYFLDHPGINDTFPNVQEGIINVVDRAHDASKFLPEKWKRTDEWYSFKKMNKEVNVLMKLDESSYDGGVRMGEHPVSWYHAYDGGRAFYTALGHTKQSFSEDLFLKHLLAGIQYAIGDNKLDYSKAVTLRVPEDDRFKKTALVSGGLFEPTEMTVLPNLDILVAQRRGEIMLYKHNDSTISQAGLLNVYFKTNTPNVNAEEGVLGLKADPDFDKNNFVYIFYSPIDTAVNRLSRFKFENDKLNMESEKVILEFYSQREICCHTGGSIAFGPDGLLYVSTGDNSTPFNEPGEQYLTNGYAPLDDREGHEQYDARRTAGNTNDLRGKILRIRIKADGSYEIPEGNLYPVGTKGTRPEIYVQGNRNPYRISVDQKNGYLYWGEVGPDARADSLNSRGPMAYDEVNQARKAGFFGWPFFVGNNYAYNEYDFGTGASGERFDPSAPINSSRNNTGITKLPPAQPAFIWYPYSASLDFPQVGTGGRTAMAGPVYYTDMYPKETRLSEYYNKKLFIYDWIRGWIKAVTLQPNGDFDKMEPFMDNTKFNSLIDMEVGPDGKIYLLEYGNGWFTKNDDAGLSRIDFIEGNRFPKVKALYADKISGGVPLRVTFSVDATDPENESLAYIWDLGNGDTKVTPDPQLAYTYNEKGEYIVTVAVRDNGKLKTKSDPVAVYAGNEAPIVKINLEGNKSFYFPDELVKYTVSVKDTDEPSAEVDLGSLFISADYIAGSDKAEASVGHQNTTQALSGKNMVKTLDCVSCHKENEKSIGPSYMDVAKRYQDSPEASNYLVNKVRNGGSGAWGETVMPAHIDMKEGDARQIVSWVLSLTKKGIKQRSLPISGTVKPTLNKTETEDGVFILTATYTDKGGNNIKPLTGETAVILRNSRLRFESAGNLSKYTILSDNGIPLMVVPKEKGSFSLDDIDLTNVAAIEITASHTEPIDRGYSFEIRLDGPNGQKIGKTTLSPDREVKKGDGNAPIMALINFDITPVTDGKFHNLYIVSKAIENEASALFLSGILLKKEAKLVN